MNTFTVTRECTCPICNRSYRVGDQFPADSCCVRVVGAQPLPTAPLDASKVQVEVLGSKKLYTYSTGGLDLRVGDRVAVPVRNFEAVGTVVAVGSTYRGECKAINSLIRRPEVADPKPEECSKEVQK